MYILNTYIKRRFRYRKAVTSINFAAHVA